MSGSQFSYTSDSLRQIVSLALEEARKGGASSAETDVSESIGSSITVRKGDVETIEYNHDKGLDVTVYLGQQKGHASTSDLSPQAVNDTVRAALSIARYTAADDCAGLADPNRLATQFPDLGLFHPSQITPETAIELARQCEAAGLAADSRISNSEGATFSSHQSLHLYANSHGFVGTNQTSRHSLSCSMIAGDTDQMQRDYWYSVARDTADLEDATLIGKTAGDRAARRLGARRIKTGEFPVLFDPLLAAGLVGHFVAAVSGGSLYRKSSFLLDAKGKAIFSPLVQIDEDPFIYKGLASSSFDAEGVATERRQLVTNGVVNGYFLGSYSARKLGLASTGNAGGCHNLLVNHTGASFDDLLAEMGNGFLVTELLGHGLNMVTGDYSRGAAGFWVENGQIAFPVEEVTIAGNLRDMYQNIIGIGKDKQIRGSKQVGSMLIRSMTVAGE